MAKGTGKRQANGTGFFPQWVWEWLGIEIGEEYEFQDDQAKHGKFVSMWKKQTED